MTSDNISGREIYLTILGGLYGENKATGEHIAVRRNLLAENVPRASKPAIPAR